MAEGLQQAWDQQSTEKQLLVSKKQNKEIKTNGD